MNNRKKELFMDKIIETIDTAETNQKPAAKRNDVISTHDTLYNMILNKELPMDVPISQTKLMNKYSFGRTPLRESLQRLADEGMVVWEMNKRIVIPSLSAEDIDQISGMRILLECYAVRQCVPLLKSEDFARMHECLDKMSVLINKRDRNEEYDARELQGLHREFHAYFIKYCGSYIQREIERLNIQSERYRVEFYNITQQYDVSYHTEMLKVAEKGDGIMVSKLLANHYAKTTLKVISEKSPLYEPTFTRQALYVISMA